jgi:hypothetical protein
VLLPGRPSTGGLLVTAAVMAALLVLTVPLLMVRSVLFGPDDTVGRYFAALADRNAADALAQLPSGAAAGNPLLTDEALADDGYTPPENAEVGEINIDGDEASAVVTYDLAGSAWTVGLTLRRGGEDTGPLHRWRITGGALQSLALPTYLPGLRVAGQPMPVDAPGSQPAGTAFPGSYAVTMADHPLLEIPPVTLVAGAEATGAVTPRLRGDVDRDIRGQVRAWLTDCAETGQVAPAGCPFSYSSFNTVRSISWSIVDEPQIQLQLLEDNQVGVSGEVSVRATGRTDSIFDPTFDETIRRSFNGTAAVSGGGIRFVPGE